MPPGTTNGDGNNNDVSTTTIKKTSLQVLPSSYSVDIPKTLKTNDNSNPNLYLSITRNLLGTKTNRSLSDVQSYGYVMIRKTIGWLQSNNLEIAKNFVLVDSAIKDMTPSSEYKLSKDITINQEMIDTIKSLSGSDSVDFEVGDIETIPFFKYVAKSGFNTSKIDTSVDTTGFDFCVMLDYCKEYGSDFPYYIYLMWSSDKKNTKIIYDYRDPIMPYKLETSFDSVKKISNMIYASESYPWVYNESLDDYYEDTTASKEYSVYNIKMQQKDDSKKGLILKQFCKYTSSGVKTEYIINGYADDNGGYCETVVTMESEENESDLGLFGSKITDKYREQFDANGMTKGWQYYNEDASYGTIGWTDFDVDGDGTSEYSWTDTEYQDDFENNEISFEQDLTSSTIDDTVNEYNSDNEATIEISLPNNVSWDTSVGESKKTFVITSDGNVPKSNGENVIGYQTIYKTDYSSTGTNNVTFNIKDSTNTSTTSYKLYEVENNVISLTGTATDTEYGSISTTKIVNFVVKGVVEVTKSATGIFQSTSAGLSTVIQGTITSKFVLPKIDASKWSNSEAAKLVVITSDKKPPLPDGSNVLGTRVVPKDVFMGAKPELKIPMTADSTENNVGMYVYPQSNAPTSSSPAKYDITTPDNPDTIEVVDANGDGEYENNESPDDPPDDDAPDQEEDTSISAPSGVVASTLQCSAITIKWNLVAGSTGYKVYYGDGKFAGASSSNLFQDTKVAVGVDTSYYVIAYKLVSGVEKLGQKSSNVTGKRPASIPTPTVSAGENDSTGINVSLTLSGTEDDDIESFEIWRKTGEVGDFTLIKTLSNDKNSDSDVFKDISVENGKKYYYKVKSKDEEDNVISDFSIADPGQMKPFTAPTGVTASNDKSDMVLVSWIEVAGAKDYEVYRSDKGKNTWEIKGTVIQPTLSFQDKTCSVGKEYDFVVVARTTNPTNESPKSAVATGKLGSGGSSGEFQTPMGTYFESGTDGRHSIYVKCTPITPPAGWSLKFELWYWSSSFSQWKFASSCDAASIASVGAYDYNVTSAGRYFIKAIYWKVGETDVVKDGPEISVPAQ